MYRSCVKTTIVIKSLMYLACNITLQWHGVLWMCKPGTKFWPPPGAISTPVIGCVILHEGLLRFLCPRISSRPLLCYAGGRLAFPGTLPSLLQYLRIVFFSCCLEGSSTLCAK